MAFNPAALKGLFSKLKPAAKTIANYGDDVAGVVANYGDDAAKALTTYGDDVARGAIDYVDDFGIRYNTMQDLDNIGRALPVDVESDFLDAVYDDSGPAGLDSFEYRYQNAVGPKHRLSELFDDGYRGFVRPDRQRLYDHAIAHGANRKKLDSLLKTPKYNSHLYSDYPELFQDDLPF
jgi:hypothetical protein